MCQVYRVSILLGLDFSANVAFINKGFDDSGVRLVWCLVAGFYPAALMVFATFQALGAKSSRNVTGEITSMIIWLGPTQCGNMTLCV